MKNIEVLEEKIFSPRMYLDQVGIIVRLDNKIFNNKIPFSPSMNKNLDQFGIGLRLAFNFKIN